MREVRPNNDAQVRADYIRSLTSDRMVRSLKLTTLFVIVVNSLFLALDYASQPGEFATLFSVRMGWNAAMAVVFWLADRFDTFRMLQVGVMSSGLALVALIAAAGGLSGDYWPGMMILFVGVPVFLPVSGAQAARMAGVLLVAFAAIPLVSGEAFILGNYVPPVFFVSAAALECIASSALLDRLRLADFIQKREIEAARDHLSEMDKVKARFTANVHHELRTPLTLTLAPLESLLAGDFGPIGEKQRSYLKTMHVNALRLLKLINNLLDLAKLESDELTITRRPIDVVSVAADLVAGARPLALQKNVELSLNRTSETIEINADPDALEKILMNLLGNALKFTESGGKIVVDVERGTGGGATLSVGDTGIGLDASQLERIFDRFAQVDSSATRKHEGTGIGLSLSQELAHLHGGTIWAESEGLDKGATLRFWLPRGEPDIEEEEVLLDTGGTAEAAAQGVLAEVGAGGSGGRFTEISRHIQRSAEPAGPTGSGLERPGIASVLVCEDNNDMRRLFLDLLSPEFNVRLASNGQEGLDSVRAARPDVVLTDVMMPVMSGAELCERIKADPETAGLPVILVTSKAEREMKIEGLENGADDYITKPFHARELLARVRSFARLSRLQDELGQRNRELVSMMEELREAETKMVHTERLAAVGELAAGIAHEVNNPVNFAKNAAQTMGSYVEECRSLAAEIRSSSIGAAEPRTSLDGRELDEALDALDELAGIVNDGLSRTGKLIGDLRDFAAPWKGERGPVDLNQIVESAMQLTGYAMQKAGVTVEVVPNGGRCRVSGDARALGQVFLNLLKNAAEAFEQPGGSVRVELRESDDGVEISVRDNGPGMSPDVVKHLFEPFFSTKPAGEGTGLGLSISRQVVAEHGGTIRVESAGGGGTEFVIWLPTEQRHAQ